jgi:hypothetical protein
MQRYFDAVQNRAGEALVGASVTVYIGGTTTPATLYSDNGVTPTANPLTTNVDGEYAFYAANGTYTLVITATNYDSETKPGTVLFDPTDVGAALPLIGTGLRANEAGYRTVPQNLKTINYTITASDSGGHIFTATSGLTFTLPANSVVPFPIGTAIGFVNGSSGNISIGINTDSLFLAGTATSGTRTLAQNGVATAVKATSTTWIIFGPGLS